MSNQSRLRIRPVKTLHGTVSVPGDKSISHRALILGALAHDKNRIRGWLAAGDTLATLEAIKSLGIQIERIGNELNFTGGRLAAPAQPIDCANAGTAMRLLAGLLVGQPFPSVLDGSEQLRQRPMRRITAPLKLMDAAISDTDGCAPIHIKPAVLRGMRYDMPVASAQVKSAVLLAGLQAQGATTVVEPGPGRDHTERMLQAMGVDLTVDGSKITIQPVGDLSQLLPLDMIIPGDISSAAFLIVAAAILPGSEIQIENVGLNPTRTGLLDVLLRMGVKVEVVEQQTQGGEPSGTLIVRGSKYNGTRICGSDVVRAIDELPILAVSATQASSETRICDAAELRLKEVDRISMVATELRKLGADIEEFPDGMLIGGPTKLHGAIVDSHGDHRLGMALAIAGLLADGETIVHDAECINDSFPGFAATLSQLGAEVDLL